tara:strand:+ start:619 stop:759 length:141 start_codon:yes stop_codon:yes gene_type:complete
LNWKPIRILGLSAYYHDNAVALVQKGHSLAAQGETVSEKAVMQRAA